MEWDDIDGRAFTSFWYYVCTKCTGDFDVPEPPKATTPTSAPTLLALKEPAPAPKLESEPASTVEPDHWSTHRTKSPRKVCERRLMPWNGFYETWGLHVFVDVENAVHGFQKRSKVHA